MQKKVYEEVKRRSHGLCEICGSNHLVEVHHIIHGKGKRNQFETVESCIDLCWEHHRGTKGVHGKDGHKLDIELKKKLQSKYFNMGYTESQVREMMGGKIYG